MKIDRLKVHSKYDGHCGYCGKEITIKEMQVDHIEPKWKLTDLQYCSTVTKEQIHSEGNLMPTCRRCNHYKRSDSLDIFRDKINTLHQRVCSHYIGQVALDYNIVEIKPFNGIFYFEQILNQNK